MWLEFVGKLIASYNQVNPLSSNEKASIWYVMLCIQTIFMAYFSNNEDFFKMNKEMFQWIFENRNLIEGKIILNIK
ncbi:hypothetical protein [Bacillus sp. JCM 19034]|uniref:hypothetical protein n=1 Tax=Bacillus sp. JCM 19034 TaxID=1481928 RepID=UPI000781B1A6|nr:hypothetical protein [Bacillus sp. JCM 19034]